MNWIDDKVLAALPEEAEEAFVALEKIVRERYEKECRELDHEESPTELHQRYISTILPAAKYYQIDGISSWEKPAPSDNSWQYFSSFTDEVDHCIMGLRLRNIERSKKFSAALDKATKIKLRHLLGQMRETIDNLDIPVAKKDRLYSCINTLQNEVDRDRTRWQAFGALMIEATDHIGKAAKKLEPVVRLAERCGAALGQAKRVENAQPKKLPPSRKPKQIEPPKKKAEKRSFENVLDDDIPF